MKRTPIRSRRHTKHQLRNLANQEYVVWLHAQPCAACGTRQNIQAAHVGQGGTGMKHGSDAETIPLCGAHDVWEVDDGDTVQAYVVGCHIEHDQCFGQFRLMTREQRRLWDATQVAAHRGRFEARGIREGGVPF